MANELQLTRSRTRGDRGAEVRRIQEWLSLRGYGLVVDGDFGAATEFAVREFQGRYQLSVTGKVNGTTFDTLVEPMRDVNGAHPSRGKLGSRIVFYARRHLRRDPREIGGQNRGPWVRLYMDGNEGVGWPWCAGFACFVLQQACSSLDVPLPIKPSVSCDSLAASAKDKGLFLKGTVANRPKVRRGDFFLSRRSPGDWSHVGIVVKAGTEVLFTIEGNTNDAGQREGYEVCQRIRSFKGKDFISMP